MGTALNAVSLCNRTGTRPVATRASFTNRLHAGDVVYEICR